MPKRKNRRDPKWKPTTPSRIYTPEEADSIIRSGFKSCGRCGQDLALASFRRDRKCPSGRASDCKACADWAGSFADKQEYERALEAAELNSKINGVPMWYHKQ
jgi:hypothetical protein